MLAVSHSLQLSTLFDGQNIMKETTTMAQKIYQQKNLLHRYIYIIILYGEYNNYDWMCICMYPHLKDNKFSEKKRGGKREVWSVQSKHMLFSISPFFDSSEQQQPKHHHARFKGLFG